MNPWVEWLLSLIAVLGVLGGYLFHPALYLVGVPLWAGLVVNEVRRERNGRGRRKRA